jgi:hypothetical protein
LAHGHVVTSLQKRAVEAASEQSNVTFRIEALTVHPFARRTLHNRAGPGDRATHRGQIRAHRNRLRLPELAELRPVRH